MIGHEQSRGGRATARARDVPGDVDQQVGTLVGEQAEAANGVDRAELRDHADGSGLACAEIEVRGVGNRRTEREGRHVPRRRRIDRRHVGHDGHGIRRHDAVEIDGDDCAGPRLRPGTSVESTHRFDGLEAARGDRRRRRPVDAGDVDDHVAALVRDDVDGPARAELDRDEVGDGRVERREVDVGRSREALAGRVHAQPVVGSEVDARDREHRGDAIGGNRPVASDRHPDRAIVETRVTETGRQARPRPRVAQPLRRQRLEEARARLDGGSDARGEQRGPGDAAGDPGEEGPASE